MRRSGSLYYAGEHWRCARAASRKFCNKRMLGLDGVRFEIVVVVDAARRWRGGWR